MGKRITIKEGDFLSDGIGRFVDITENIVLVSDRTMPTYHIESQIIGNPVEDMFIQDSNSAYFSISRIEVTNPQSIYYIEVVHNYLGGHTEFNCLVGMITDINGNLIETIPVFQRDSTERKEIHEIDTSKYSNIGYIYISGLRKYKYHAAMKDNI